VIRTRNIAIALLALVAALALAGCGSDDNSGGGGGYGGKGSSATSTEATTTPSTANGAAMLTVASAPEVGTVLVDADGFTVYDFHKDKGTTSSCYGACAKVWPPVITKGAPKAGDGAMPSRLGTTKRKDGTVQVTYAGHPLYTYVTDKKPGEANGQDIDSFGAEWYALQGSGEEAED
jgi:predicted lipoprotein with Yx(FWY)xxD motif